MTEVDLKKKEFNRTNAKGNQVDTDKVDHVRLRPDIRDAHFVNLHVVRTLFCRQPPLSPFFCCHGQKKYQKINQKVQ